MPPNNVPAADADQALVRSEARFRALVNASADMIYTMSADWSEIRSVEGNAFIEHSPQPAHRWVDQYLVEPDKKSVTDLIARCIATRSIFDCEHQVRRNDGTIAWVHSRAVPMFDANGAIAEWIGTAIDISARKAAEESTANQRRRYEAILGNTPDLAYIWDLDHRFTYANEGLLKMWGKSWDEAIGKNCLELGYEPWHAAMHDREIEQVRSTRLPVRGEVPFNGAFGRRMYDYLLVPVMNADGEVEAVAGITRDVTDRKNLEDSLREADRRKDEFLATLAHELRNPLAPIRNSVQVLKVGGDDPDKVRVAREIIDRQVGHMVRLVDDLLDVSRITLGQVNLRSERISLQDVLKDSLDAVAPALADSRHNLTTAIPQATIWLDGDATRLAQVFQNMLDNAVKYTPAGGEINLTVRTNEREARISVRDTGVGIAPEMQPRVFQMFTRLQPGERIKTSGLGIGLSLAQQLLLLHQGRIEVRSEGTGRGSEFIVYLPIAPEAPAAPAAGGASHATGAGGARVLIVDDNRDAAESLGILLEMSGCAVACAFSGPQALELVETHQPEIVLLDIGMPGMDGYEVAQRIRSNTQIEQPVVVALTGWGQAEDRERATRMGFDEHLTKPVDPALLSTVVQMRRRTSTA